MTATGDPIARTEQHSPGYYTRITLTIAAAVGTANMSFNFWSPFMPLFMLQVGARDEADAVFWLAIATTSQGIARLLTSPLWGMWADRVGRKNMLLRCLFFASIANLAAVPIFAPWQLIISFLLQGAFSGYVPASAALVSVSVPDSRINRSLSIVTSAQYLGNTVGPMLGALIVLIVDYRGAIAVASLFPFVSALSILFLVPRDQTGSTSGTSEAAAAAETPAAQPEKLAPFRPTFQFGLAVLVVFAIFSMTQSMRLLGPIAVKAIDPGNVEGAIGITFTLGGLASAVSLVFLAPRFFRTGNMRRAMVVSSVLSGACMLALAFAHSVPLFIIGFSLFSLFQAAMIPAANTLIAASVHRDRRGTAFGIASSVQAIAFMIGPFLAAIFVSKSIDVGFTLLAAVLVALGVLLLLCLREPRLSEPDSSEKANA